MSRAFKQAKHDNVRRGSIVTPDVHPHTPLLVIQVGTEIVMRSNPPLNAIVRKSTLEFNAGNYLLIRE